MRFNHNTSNIVPSDQMYDNLNNIPMAGYGAFNPVSQSQSIVNNMMYYQGIYYLVKVKGNCIPSFIKSYSKN